MITKKLRIVFVTNNYTPYEGGVVSSINSFVQQMRFQGHEVSIITLDFAGVTHDEDYVFRIPCPLRFTYKKNAMAVPWRPDYQVRQLIEKLKPTIIHSQHPFLLGNSAYKAGKALGIPVFFTYHTVYEEYVHYIPLPAMFTRYAVKKLVHRYCSAVDGIVAPSIPIQQYLASQAIATKTEVIPSGLQPIFVRTQQPVKTMHGKINLLVVSRFVPEKNIACIIELFSHLDQQRFILKLIGFGSEFEPLKKYAYTTLRLSPDAITFIHKPEKSVIIQAYKTADLFLFSSHTDVQPLALVESMASATPVIALAGTGRDIIKSGYNGYIVDSVDAMIATINRLADDKELLRTLQSQAFITGQEYTPQHTTERLLKFYQQCVP